MFTIGLYVLAFILLLLSLIRSQQKTLLVIKKAWKSFENILPLLLTILLIIGIILSILSPQVISKILGQQSGFMGLIFAAIIGSCIVIPGFVTFPLAADLLKSGAGMTQIIVFISTSVMVGVLTIPIEIKYFGKKTTYIRNLMALGFSFIIAAVMGGIMR
jgi:uncharacterized membrane protein YraQ (UPF0718 family)